MRILVKIDQKYYTMYTLLKTKNISNLKIWLFVFSFTVHNLFILKSNPNLGTIKFT